MALFKHFWRKLGVLVCSLAILICGNLVQAKDELKDVRLRVFMFPLGSPSAFFKDDIKTLHGLDVDIVHELQRRLGFDIVDNRIYPINFAEGIGRLEKGEIDLLGGDMAFNEERAAKFAHTPIYLQSALCVAFSKRFNGDIKDFDDLKGLKIGTDFKSVDGAFAEFVKSVGAEPVSVTDIPYSLFMVAQDRLDAVVYDRLPVEDFVLGVKSAKLQVLEKVFGSKYAQYTFYMPKKSPYRYFIIDEMQKMMDDGTIDKLLQKWQVTKVVVNEQGKELLVHPPKEA